MPAEKAEFLRLFETQLLKSEPFAEYVATQSAYLLAWLLGGLHSETGMTLLIKGDEELKDCVHGVTQPRKKAKK